MAGDNDDGHHAAYTAWRTDIAAGKTSIMIADTRNTMTVLNARARDERSTTGHVDPTSEVSLCDGTRASTGDVVITRRNDRRLSTGAGRIRSHEFAMRAKEIGRLWV